jgi:hypothetical protein
MAERRRWSLRRLRTDRRNCIKRVIQYRSRVEPESNGQPAARFYVSADHPPWVFLTSHFNPNKPKVFHIILWIRYLTTRYPTSHTTRIQHAYPRKEKAIIIARILRPDPRVERVCFFRYSDPKIKKEKACR